MPFVRDRARVPLRMPPAASRGTIARATAVASHGRAAQLGVAMERRDVVVVGAGQAGLATSHRLTELGIDHLVLEAGGVGETWRSRRWDSFTLVTPNWMTRLPGLSHRPDEPGVFIPRDEIVAMLGGYAASFGAPVRTETPVTRVERAPDGAFRVDTPGGPIQARAVVVATGFQVRARRAPFADAIAPRILQLTSDRYRDPSSLPDGGVLVVGSAQSGCQIAEDLLLGGREVHLSVGRSPRVPRRYRGRDCFDWLVMTGRLDKTENEWPDPRGRFAPNPSVSGARGGRTTNLHRYARDGMRLAGRITAADGERLTIAPDLHDVLRRIDRATSDALRGIDEMIAARGIDAAAADPSDPQNWDEYFGDDGFAQPVLEELDLRAAGIATIVWCCGFDPAYDFVSIPVFDATGTPVHRAGFTDVPGLAFVGVKFQRRNGSDLLWGVAEDAAIVADGVAAGLGTRAATQPA